MYEMFLHIFLVIPNPTDAVSSSLQSVLGIILGGGAGTRLYPLTKKRAKPAVPLGANYRLIDIPVSNCLNSNVSKIYVLTQFNSASLNRHLSRAYGTNISGYKNEGFVEVLAAQQSPENPNWFQVRRSVRLLSINLELLVCVDTSAKEIEPRRSQII
jgi:ADP-glucose pyrophosphorylase